MLFSMDHRKLLPSNTLLYQEIKLDIGKAVMLLAPLQLITKITLYYIVVRMCVYANTGNLVWELISLCVLNVLFYKPLDKGPIDFY